MRPAAQQTAPTCSACSSAPWRAPVTELCSSSLYQPSTTQITSFKIKEIKTKRWRQRGVCRDSRQVILTGCLAEILPVTTLVWCHEEEMWFWCVVEKDGDTESQIWINDIQTNPTCYNISILEEEMNNFANHNQILSFYSIHHVSMS